MILFRNTFVQRKNEPCILPLFFSSSLSLQLFFQSIGMKCDTVVIPVMKKWNFTEFFFLHWDSEDLSEIGIFRKGVKRDVFIFLKQSQRKKDSGLSRYPSERKKFITFQILPTFAKNKILLIEIYYFYVLDKNSQFSFIWSDARVKKFIELQV